MKRPGMGIHVISFILVICAKKLSQFGGPLVAGAPCHGTIGTMVNPALRCPLEKPTLKLK